ncbi:MAG: DinB family protein [Spirochaetaceae bacterium]|nr:DinB family protein [Spirochaetaceae bacterium]
MDTFLDDLVIHQFEAAMCTLNQCIAHCPEEHWNAPHFDSPFCRVLFHVLIFTDIYLGRDEEAIKTQEFHLATKAMFRDYEELEDREPVQTYSLEEIRKYFDFCLAKGREEIAKESEESLRGASGFSFRKFSRLELYVYLIRHIQHHAAQLGLRLQKEAGRELSWVGSGWPRE